MSLRITTVSELLADEPVSRVLAFFAERETALRARVDQATADLAEQQAKRTAELGSMLNELLPDVIAVLAEAVTQHQRKRGYLPGGVGCDSGESVGK